MAARKTTLTSKVGILTSNNDMRGKGRQAAMEKVSARAFTFIEVIVALAVVSISLLALLRLHMISITMADVAETTSQATFVAESKIAEALALGYPEVGATSGCAEKNNLSFYWKTEVTDLCLSNVYETDITGLREVFVDVSWKQRAGRKHVQLSTYVADRELR